MTNWRVLIPIGIAAALWVIISRGNVPANLTLPTATTAPCHPTAAEVAATDIAEAALPTPPPDPKSPPAPTIDFPVVTTELVVLAEDRDVPQLIPSLVIRAPARDQSDINKLLALGYVDTESAASPPAVSVGAGTPTPVPISARVESNTYRRLLRQLLTNEVTPDAGDEIGLLTGTSTNYTSLLLDALGISEPPLVGVAGNGTVTLVIPQSPRPLTNNEQAFAGGWTIDSSGRIVTFIFEGQPEAKTAWDVRVCTNGLPIISTSLISPTPLPATAVVISSTPILDSATPIAGSGTPMAAAASSLPVATPLGSSTTELQFQNPNQVQWSFASGRSATAVKVAAQAPLLSSFRMWLFTGYRQDIAPALALLIPSGILLIGTIVVFWSRLRGADGAKGRLAATSMAIVRLAIAAALFYSINPAAVQSTGWDRAVRGWLIGAGGSGAASAVPANRFLTLPLLIVAMLVILGLLDYPWPRIEGVRQVAEEVALGLVALALVMISFIYLAWAVPKQRDQYGVIDPVLLIAAFTMFLATAIRLWSQHGPGLEPWRAMALPAIGAFGVFLCALRGGIDEKTEHPFIVGGLIPLWITVCLVAGFVLLATALLRDIPVRERSVRPQTKSEVGNVEQVQRRGVRVWIGVGVGLALTIVVILLQWGWAFYNRENIWWRATVEADPLPNAIAIADSELAHELFNYPRAFSVSVIEILILLGLLGLVAVLHATAQTPESGQDSTELSAERAVALALLEPGGRDWKSHHGWIKWILAGLFAAFVIGYGGQVLGLRVPIAFLIGLGLIRVTLSGRANEESERIADSNDKTKTGASLILTHRHELLQRALGLLNADHQLAKALAQFLNGEISAAEYKTKWDSARNESVWSEAGNNPHKAKTSPLKLAEDQAPGEIALMLGPRESWWDNGRLALNLGGWLAIIPIGYFIYVFLTSRGAGSWSLSLPFAVTNLFTALAYEVAFWLVAAFTFGCLYRYLPGRSGPVKGVALAAVYVGANAGAALFGIPGNTLWQVRSFQLVLFLMLLGAWMDLRTVEAEGFKRRDLIALYDLPNSTTLISQVLPLVTALAVVVGQLLAGQTQAATENLVTGDTGQLILSLLQRLQ